MNQASTPSRPPNVAVDLPGFRRGLTSTFCAVGFWIALLTSGVNVALSIIDAMFAMSALGVVVSGGLWLWLRRRPEALDSTAAILVGFVVALIAVGWVLFEGALGSSPALLFPLAGFTLLFTTRRRQRLAFVSLIVVATLLYSAQLFAPHLIGPYYEDENAQLWDVASSQWLCLIFVGWMFIRASAHHLQGWEELARQQAAHLALVQHEANRAEEELLQRLELTRHMSDGLAHDLNNMLGVIRISAECMQNPEEAELRDSIVAGVTTASRLVDRFRTTQAAQAERLDLAVLLSSLRRSIHSIAPEVEIEVDVADGGQTVFLPRIEFEQVVMNLTLNSVHAMQGAGRLTISAQPAQHAQMEVAVCDTGCGIAEDDLPLIFEPFFTTRAEQGGTGVGLANVRQIVDGWQGQIEVDSTVGVGTCVRIRIPSRPES